MPPQPRHTSRGAGLVYELRQRKITPEHTLLAYTDSEDEPRKVNIPDVAQKWKRVMLVLDELHWTKVEVVNKRGELMYTHKRGPEDEKLVGDLEDLTAGHGASGTAANMSAIMGVACHWLLKGQEVALSRHDQSTAQLLDASLKMMDTAEKRYVALDKQYGDLMRVNHALHGDAMAQQMKALKTTIEKAGITDEEGGPISDALLEQLLPDIVRALVKKDAPAVIPKKERNGHITNKVPA